MDTKFNPDKVNQLLPEVMGINSNINGGSDGMSPGRSYMFGNMLPKSVVTNGNDAPLLMSGFEPQYGKHARKIEVPSNMTVSRVFYMGDAESGKDELGEWETVFVVFRNEELNKYDLLELKKYHVQNTYIAWEYVYDKAMMRRLTEGATYRKGEVFAVSPRVAEDGSWCFGTETKIAAMSSHLTEEDGIVVFESYAREKLGCVFKHDLGFNWDEDDYVPVMCYGTEEEPRPFPEKGEKVRSDGVVMAFRKRIKGMALTTLSERALRRVDYNNDILFRTKSTDAEVVSISVISDRVKNMSNNRRNTYIEQNHNKILTAYERQSNNFNCEIIHWYEDLCRRNDGEIDITHQLHRFITQAYFNYTIDPNKRGNPVNRLKRRVKLDPVKDWKVNVTLRENVKGKTKFKLSGPYGNKGVIVKVLPDEYAPTYKDGTRADILIDNTPYFRRQIYAGLKASAINFINLKVHKKVIDLYSEDKVQEAYDELCLFYKTVSPEFYEIVKSVHVTAEDVLEHVEHIVNNKVQVQLRSDSETYGAGIIRNLMKTYNHKPEKATFVNALGETVETETPILITSMYYLLLDKFGTDASSQALPKHNLFGYPSKLNELDKNASYQREVLNRNLGEGESMLQITQKGPKDVVKQLALSYSGECQTKVVKRLLRADNPFDIDRLVDEEDFASNNAVKMAKTMLSDAGYRLRKKQQRDTYVPPIDIE